ncbi:MAG: hypothetical protein LBJ67_04540 [Planctomycetaceae bacterium]|jgi:DNA-binding response OmpR family regulator|nr:hypothetical protein [Planctomycetaceae bacterium]
MTSKKQHTYPEIRQEIDHHVQRLVILLAEEDEIIRQTLPESKHAEIPLQFDDAKRTISWLGGSVRLAQKQYLLVKTLWQSKGRRANIEKIERHVWQHKGTKKELFKKRQTISICVLRSQKSLQNAHFPYNGSSFSIKQEFPL